MVIADFIALAIALGILGIGGKSVFSAWTQSSEARRIKDDEQRVMRAALALALETHDYRKLQDFLVLWGDKIDHALTEHIEQRIDELYIETNEGTRRT